MTRSMLRAAAALAALVVVSGCVVAPAPVYRGPPPACPPGTFWHHGFYGPWGGWHPGHCAP